MPPPLSDLFIKTITIETLNPGRYRVVGSARSAAEALLEDFPSAFRNTVSYGDASRVCLAALEGKSYAVKARKAFLEAARTAGIFIREGR